MKVLKRRKKWKFSKIRKKYYPGKYSSSFDNVMTLTSRIEEGEENFEDNDENMDEEEEEEETIEIRSVKKESYKLEIQVRSREEDEVIKNELKDEIKTLKSEKYTLEIRVNELYEQKLVLMKEVVIVMDNVRKYNRKKKGFSDEVSFLMTKNKKMKRELDRRVEGSNGMVKELSYLREIVERTKLENKSLKQELKACRDEIIDLTYLLNIVRMDNDELDKENRYLNSSVKTLDAKNERLMKQLAPHNGFKLFRNRVKAPFRIGRNSPFSYRNTPRMIAVGDNVI